MANIGSVQDNYEAIIDINIQSVKNIFCSYLLFVSVTSRIHLDIIAFFLLISSDLSLCYEDAYFIGRFCINYLING